MNIIEAVKQVLSDCDLMDSFTGGIHVDFTEPSDGNCGLSSVGDALFKEDILGNQIRQHNFVLYAVAQSINDYDRLVNSTFLLDLTYYLETIEGIEIDVNVAGTTKSGEITEMSSANGMMYQYLDESMTGPVMYQLQIYAKYTVKESEE